MLFYPVRSGTVQMPHQIGVLRPSGLSTALTALHRQNISLAKVSAVIYGNFVGRFDAAPCPNGLRDVASPGMQFTSFASTRSLLAQVTVAK